MDAFGHVNNVMFFRYFESARISYLQAVDGGDVGRGEMKPILAHTECSYLRPVYFPDTLLAETRVTKLGRSSVSMEYRLTSRMQDEEVARGRATVVNVDPETGQSAPLSESLKEKILALEGGQIHF